MVDVFDGLPRNHFGAILADCPWRFKTFSEAGRNRCPDWKSFRGVAARHYDTMSMDEIMALPVADLAAPDCCLFMWISWPLLPEALELMKTWGFTYKTCAFSWIKGNAKQLEFFQDDIKPALKLGYWTRSNSEVNILGIRGNPKRLAADVRQAIVEPAREHSRKPDCVHGRIERLVSGPYLELFARQSRPNWTVWGNQTTRFDQPTGGANVSSGNEDVRISNRNGTIPDGESGEIARATEAIPIGDTGS